jgi:hypothetical protein
VREGIRVREITNDEGRRLPQSCRRVTLSRRYWGTHVRLAAAARMRNGMNWLSQEHRMKGRPLATVPVVRVQMADIRP